MSLEDRLIQWPSGDDSLLYHYTTLTSACKILDSNRLKLSNLLNTNDPLEFSLSQSFGFVGWGEIDEKKVFSELMISRKRRENSVRMLCFCKDMYCNSEDFENNQFQNFTDSLLHKGWARSRMWAQYADNHNGICFVFDKNILKRLFEDLKDDSIYILPDQDIEYSNYLTNLEAAMSNINHQHDIEHDYTNFYLEDERQKYLFQKCEDYRDENEHRFCLINTKLSSPDEPMYIEYKNSLLAIIYGQRFSSILKLNVPDDVEQYKIFWEYGKPKLYKMKK